MASASVLCAMAGADPAAGQCCDRGTSYHSSGGEPLL